MVFSLGFNLVGHPFQNAKNNLSPEQGLNKHLTGGTPPQGGAREQRARVVLTKCTTPPTRPPTITYQMTHHLHHTERTHTRLGLMQDFSQLNTNKIDI